MITTPEEQDWMNMLEGPQWTNCSTPSAGEADEQVRNILDQFEPNDEQTQ